MNENYTKLKDFARKRLDDSCKNDDDDVRYWVGYIDGLNALHKELCKTEEALKKQIPKKPINEECYYICPCCGRVLDWSEVKNG